MKLLRIMWLLSALWAAFFAYLAFDFFGAAWRTDAPLLEWGEKIKTYLAGVGSLSVGALPPLGTWGVHRFYKSRERVRLQRRRRKIDRRIERLDQKQAAKGSKTAVEAT